MHKVYLLLGSNEGNCLEQITRAIELIELQLGHVIKKSSIYKSEPWGFETENFFLNQVILVETENSPSLILDTLLEIEKLLGRKRNQNGYESRTIDIDILFYDNIIIETNNLKIPHPLMALRRFTLVPLNEIATDFLHPATQLTIAETLNQCEDKLKVIKYTANIKLNCKFLQNK